MIMTFERLQYLVAVAETGSFSAAGRKLGVSASAVQQSIQNMELDLNLELFDRGAGRSPKLTDIGKSIYMEALELIPKLDYIEQRALAYTRGIESQLTISVHGLVFYSRYQQVLVEFNKRYPEVNLRMIDSEHCGLRTEANPNGADIMLAPASMGPLTTQEERLIDRMDWIFVAATCHPLARIRGEINYQDLSRYSQLLPLPGLVCTKELIDGMRFSSKVIEFECFYQFRQMLLRGLAFAFYPSELAAPMLERGDIKQLQVDFDESVMGWPIRLAWVAGLGEAGQWLLEALQNC